MNKFVSLFFGIFFIALGILGFIPFLIWDDYLLYILKVNTATNLMHMLLGGAAFWAYVLQPNFQKIYFQIVGFILLILALFGFMHGSSSLFGFLANNPLWTWIHLILGLVALYLGFNTKRKKT